MRRQRERERAEKERAAQLEYAKKMAEEARKTKEAEDLISLLEQVLQLSPPPKRIHSSAIITNTTPASLLEQEEMNLITRLKKTQVLQEKAYATLQNSLDL